MEKISLEAHKKMVGNEAAFSFRGSVDIELIDRVLYATHAKLESFEPDPKIRRSVYLVLVECLQNLCKQTETLKLGDRSKVEYDNTAATFVIEKDSKGYYIATANFVENEKVENLKNWLDEINTYTRQELKLVYNKILMNKSYSSQGGAGLGFVDIALKSNKKLEFSFHKVDEHYTFFNMNITVEK